MKLFRSRKRPVSREVTHRGRRAEVGEGGGRGRIPNDGARRGTGGSGREAEEKEEEEE